MSEGAEWNDKIVEMARAFHDEYEVQAKRFGWQSRTPVSFDELPEANKQTMLNVIAQVVPWNVVADLADLRALLAQRDREIEALRKVVGYAFNAAEGQKTDIDRYGFDESSDETVIVIYTLLAAALSDPESPADL